MPIYEYRCQSCNHELEALQKMHDAELRDCPHCGQPQLQKLISAAAFRLKGSGWYETDFKSSSNQKNVAKSETDSSASSTSCSDSSSSNSSCASCPAAA